MKKRSTKIYSLLMMIMCFVLLSGFAPAKDTRDEKKYVVSSIDQIESIKYEDTLSYNEMIQYMSDNNYSKDEINSFQNEQQRIQEKLDLELSLLTNKAVSSTQVRYSLFGMKTFSYKYGIWDTCKVQATFSVGLLWYSGSESPDSIVSISGEHVYTGGGSSCIFSGSLFYRLESGNRFYYSMYGNLYKKGDVNWKAGGSIGVGSSATLNASISNGDGFIKNISESQSYYSSGMNP